MPCLRHYRICNHSQMIKVTRQMIANYYGVSIDTVKRRSKKYGGLKTVSGAFETIIHLSNEKQR